MADARVSMRIVVSYRLLEVVDIEHGEWCPRCLLPSAATVTLASQAVIGGVEGPLKLSTGVRCLEGHGWLRTEGP